MFNDQTALGGSQGTALLWGSEGELASREQGLGASAAESRSLVNSRHF